MVMGDFELWRRVRLYAKGAGVATDRHPFDGGQDGTVWRTDRHSVLKAFERERAYLHELECYRRLRDSGIGTKLNGFNVPQLLGHSDTFMVIEMGLVTPPYILDFGKAHLHDPRWPAHVIEGWNEQMADWWGDDVKQVRLLLAALKRFGIWYYDAKPGNVRIRDSDLAID